MNLIVDVCRKNPEVYAAPASPAEVLLAIRRAREKGWRISGPDMDGSYVTCDPGYVDVKTNVKFPPAVLRIPDGTFLIDFLRDTNPFFQVVEGCGRNSNSPHPGRTGDLSLVDP